MLEACKPSQMPKDPVPWISVQYQLLGSPSTSHWTDLPGPEAKKPISPSRRNRLHPPCQHIFSTWIRGVHEAHPTKLSTLLLWHCSCQTPTLHEPRPLPSWMWKEAAAAGKWRGSKGRAPGSRNIRHPKTRPKKTRRPSMSWGSEPFEVFMFHCLIRLHSYKTQTQR